MAHQILVLLLYLLIVSLEWLKPELSWDLAMGKLRKQESLKHETHSWFSRAFLVPQ